MRISDEIRQFKTRLIRGVLEQTHGNIRQTARHLGTKPATMQRWVTLLGLDVLARDLRRRRAWWLADRCAVAGAMLVTMFYAAHPMI